MPSTSRPRTGLPLRLAATVGAGLLVALGTAPAQATAGTAAATGTVVAWASGENNWGEATVPAEALSGVSAIGGGDYHSLAVKNGKVLMWGTWIDPARTSVPVPVSGAVLSRTGRAPVYSCGMTRPLRRSVLSGVERPVAAGAGRSSRAVRGGP